MSRIARVVVPGALHHVTQRGNFGSDVFFDDSDRVFFLENLSAYGARANVDIASYCLMDNHTHLLLIPNDPLGLAKLFKPLHMRYSQRLNYRFKRVGLNWQGRFFSSPMDKEHSWHAFRYVSANPVRAGMVEQMELYKWSSARNHIEKSASSILTASADWLEMAHNSLRFSQGRSLVSDQMQILKRNTFKNLPTGSSDFIEDLEGRFGRDLKVRERGRPVKG